MMLLPAVLAMQKVQEEEVYITAFSRRTASPCTMKPSVSYQFLKMQKMHFRERFLSSMIL